MFRNQSGSRLVTMACTVCVPLKEIFSWPSTDADSSTRPANSALCPQVETDDGIAAADVEIVLQASVTDCGQKASSSGPS